MKSFFYFSQTIFTLLLLRASLDPILDLTRVGGIGFGAVINFILVLCVCNLILKNNMLVSKSIIKIWSPFIVIGLFSISISPDKISSLRSFFTVITYFSWFFIPFYYVKNEAEVKALIKLIIYSSIIPFVFAGVEFIFPAGSTGNDGFRVFGSFSHPNIFAFYLVLISSICFFTFKSTLIAFDVKFIKHAKIIFMICIICLLATKTRSAWIALVIVFLVYGLLIERRYIVYLIILTFIAFLIPSIQERILDIFSGNSIDILEEGGKLNSYAWRNVVWSAAWGYIIEKPFFGHGYNSFSYYFLEFFPLESDTSFDAHNTYVQIAFDMGFLGVIAYLFLFSMILARMIKYFKVDKKGGAIIIGLVISYLVVGYSDNLLFYLSYNWYFWFFIGIFFVYSQFNCQSTNRDKEDV